ncbi:MAG: IS630 family transposase [Deltaproteobacteria bacterium]|nr:IS630 family transposase [Deltaproteobacteria bacterium]
MDESGFCLIPPVRKTWAPKGQTPVLTHRYRHERISVIAGLSVSPKRLRCGLYFDFSTDNINGEAAAEFLRQLLRHLPGPIIVLWDNVAFHRSRPVKDLLARTTRLHLEAFPPYAPDLNPVEHVWSVVKSDLANGRPDDVHDLLGDLTHRITQTALSQRRLRRCVHEAQLSLFLTSLLRYLCRYQ